MREAIVEIKTFGGRTGTKMDVKSKVRTMTSWREMAHKITNSQAGQQNVSQAK